MLVLADRILAFVVILWQVFAGAGIWGLHMGFTQGLFNKLVAGSSTAELALVEKKASTFRCEKLSSSGKSLSLWVSCKPSARSALLLRRFHLSKDREDPKVVNNL